MVSRRRLTLLFLIPASIFIFAAACAPLVAQNGVDFPPVPAGPYEIVTGGAQILMTPAERAEGLNLLAVAGQNYTFGQTGRPDTTLVVQLQSSGTARYEGEGSWQQTWLRERNGWWSNFAGVTNAMGDDVERNPVPMRVHMSRMALLWPVDRMPALKQIRVAKATWESKPVTCVLVTDARVAADSSARGWREAEYCMDSGGLLRFMSPAPGVYFIYDYSVPLSFAGHTVAGNITVVENDTKVMEIHVARLGSPSASDVESVTQTRPMPGILGEWRVNSHPRVPSETYRVDNVVVVHATVSPSGRLLEYELPGGESPLAQAAVKRVESLTLRRGRNLQCEIYVRVETANGQ